MPIFRHKKWHFGCTNENSKTTFMNQHSPKLMELSFVGGMIILLYQAHKFDPSKSNAIAAINLEERGQPEGPHPRGCWKWSYSVFSVPIPILCHLCRTSFKPSPASQVGDQHSNIKSHYPNLWRQLQQSILQSKALYFFDCLKYFMPIIKVVPRRSLFPFPFPG